MIALATSSTTSAPVEILKAALPIGIGLASAAYLTIKAASYNSVIGEVKKRSDRANERDETSFGVVRHVECSQALSFFFFFFLSSYHPDHSNGRCA